MGRRALRKIDPSLDLTPYLFQLEDLEPPFDNASFFGRDAPLEIEVGSGKGLFMQTASASVPDHNFLGIEVAKKYAKYAASRLAKHNLANGKMISGDALRFFREFLGDHSVEVVHVYFPDPWWKKRHHKRRVMNQPFLNDVERVLVPGGTLSFWTDVAEYYDASLELIAEVTQLEGPIPVDQRDACHDLDYRTHFERRMRLRDLPVHRAEFRTPDNVQPAT